MKAKTLTRVAKPLIGRDKRLRVSHTVPRPEGWAESTADMARWETMIRMRK